MSTEQVSLRWSFNPVLEISRITSFIETEVERVGSNGVVVGISGGVDSAVTAALCKNALSSKRMLGLLLFEDSQRDSDDMRDAKAVASSLRIKTCDMSISPILKAYEQVLGSWGFETSKITSANIKARSRMVLLYSLANQKRLMVAGTGDRSEILLGYFTKFGDGAADIFPIAHLYKTEVRAIAKQLGLPSQIASKPSTPNLWDGQRAKDDLPADYPLLDKILTLLYDHSVDSDEVSKILGISPAVATEVARILRIPSSVVREVSQLHANSNHKRELPRSIPS